MGGECGDCTMCCFLTGVPELDKPPGVLCGHCDVGVGCGVYAKRPRSCREFECVWLRDSWEDALRPDRCHLMFEQIPGSDAYVVLREPGHGNAWLSPLPQARMRELAAGGSPVVVRIGRTVQVLTPENVSASGVWEQLKEAYRKLL